MTQTELLGTIQWVPTSWSAWYFLYQRAYEAGDHRQAYRYIKRAHELHPGHSGLEKLYIRLHRYFEIIDLMEND